MTRNTQLILDIINTSYEHPTTEKIYLKLKEQSSKAVLATVYNNLAKLYEQGLIRKISVEGQPDRYDNITRHDHLVCKCCGGLTDIVLDDLTSQLRNQIDDEFLSYDLKINYICPTCRNNGNK